MSSRLALTVLLAVSLVAAGCGNKKDVVTHGETEGIYVDVGELKYQVQISRQLNPASTEDKTYLTGLKAEDRELAEGEVWFAVFIRVQNETDRTLPPAEEFEIEDTQGTAFHPVELASINPFAYRATPLTPGSLIPKVDSTASEGSIQGSLLLFKIPGPVLDNRPLEFVIRSPHPGERAGTVELDI